MRRLTPRIPVMLGMLSVLGLFGAHAGCADGHDDGHHIPADVEASAALTTLPMALGLADYGPANWVKSGNYSTASRGKGQITTIVVHTVQGSYKGCISWFQNPAAKVSAHFVLGKNGEVTQMVKEKDIAWHVGSANGYTVGIEHEGFVSDANWVTPKMLDASAKLSCYLVKKYGLTATKTHIKGHVELPNQTHTDPGKYWPWDSYLKKVKDCVGGKVEPPTKAGCCTLKVAATGSTVIDNTGNNCIQKFGSAATWWNATDTGYGGSMNYTYTSAVSSPDNWARWRLTFAKAGKYSVDVWIPAQHAGATVTYKIKHGGAVSTAKINQKVYTNQWVKLGEWDFKADCDEWVVLEDSQGVKGVQMGVDAVRLTLAGQPPKCPASCSDNNPCTDDSCVSGQCVHKNNSAACNDGKPCTLGEVCTAGACKWKTWKPCSDGNPCTDDACSQNTGACESKANSAACDDGNPCTKGDACAGGKCKAGTGATCGDGNPCTKDVCDSKGGCQHSPVGGPCDDGNPCTSSDACVASKCQGQAKICDDANPCTDDFCGVSGCGAKPNKMFCDDGDGCTSGDHCVSGNCVGALTACSDANPCTADLCQQGACTYTAILGSCDDGSDCSTADKCAGGQCVGGPSRCDDGEACTKDECVGAGCKNELTEGLACDDGDACSAGDSCVAGKCEAGEDDGCDDGNACTTDRCTEGSCKHTLQRGCDTSGADGQSSADGAAGQDSGGLSSDVRTQADASAGGGAGPPTSGCAASGRSGSGPWPLLLLLLPLGLATRRRDSATP